MKFELENLSFVVKAIHRIQYNHMVHPEWVLATMHIIAFLIQQHILIIISKTGN